MEKEQQTKKRTPEEVLEWRKQKALEGLLSLEGTIKKAQSELQAVVADKEGDWEKANLMADVVKSIAGANQRISEVGRQDYFVDRETYKQSLESDYRAFLDKNENALSGNDKAKDLVDYQFGVLTRTCPGNFARVRETAANIVGKENKELGDSFYESFSLPKQKAVVKSSTKETSKEQDSAMER